MTDLNELTFRIPKHTDRVLYDKFIEIEKESGAKIECITFRLFHCSEEVTITLNNRDVERNERADKTFALETIAIKNCKVSFNFIDIKIDRQVQLHDDVSVILNRQSQDFENMYEVLKIVGIAKNKLGAFKYPFADIKAYDEELNRYNERKQNDLMQLENIVTNALKKDIEFKESLRKEFSEDLQARKNELEDFYAAAEIKRKEEYDLQLAEIVKQRKELENEKTKLDILSNTDARRKLRKEEHERIKQQFNDFRLTLGTRKLRIFIYILLILLLIVFGIAFCYYIYQGAKADISSQSLSSVIYWSVKQLVFAFAFGSTAIFLIRWQNNWFKQNADEEFRWRRLGMDIDRSNWIVEMALEWRNISNKDIPRSLVSKLARNLFVDDRLTNETLHPLEDVMKTIKETRCKIAAGDVEIEMGKEGAKNKKK